MTFRTDASSQAIQAAGASVLVAYGAFALARGPATALTQLESEGHYAIAMGAASQLQLLSGNLDVHALAAAAPPAWIRDDGGAAAGVVHFIGPILASWEIELAARGISVLDYVPTNGLLVRGPPSALEALGSLSYVDYVGPYEPAWKIPPGLPASGPAVDVRIVALPGEPARAIEAWLAHEGVPARPASGDAEAIVGAFGSGEFAWVQAWVEPGRIPDIAALPWVEFIDPVYVPAPLNAETDWVIQTNVTGNYRYWTYGLDGSGQVIGVADTGLDFDNPQFRQSVSQITIGDIYNVTDTARRKVVRYVDMGVLTGALTWPGGGGLWDPYSAADCAYNDAANGHGTAVVSTAAGNDDGIGTSPNDGNAKGAQVYMQDIGGLPPGTTCADGESILYLPADYTDLFGPPGLVYNDPVAPVRIHSDSWGAKVNAYDVQARAVDAYVWAHPDLSVIFAAGNSGPNAGTVDTPATAKNILSVGGTCNPDGTLTGCAQNDIPYFSSRGPTSDGRFAPTILTVAAGDSATSDGSPWDNVVTTPDHGWAGTSYAAPAAAGATAIVRQYFVDGWYPTAAPVAGNGFDPSAALIRATLIASGAQVTGSGASAATTWPNNDQGFGRVLLSSVLPIAAAGDTFRTQVVDQTVGLLTGQALTYTFHVNPGSGTLKFVIAWTDYPGTLGAAKELVNDLDLQITAPNGTVYRGNNFGSFAWGQSTPGGSFDSANNEEAVIVKAPAAGDWKVQVIGASVPEGPQPFALVATGGLDPNYGRVLLDRPSYSESDTVRISVVDGDATSVLVHVTSSFETAGEDVSLTQAVPGPIWRGSIATALGQPAPDGVLQVRGGDTITVAYVDASPAHTATATATVITTTPAITGVEAEGVDATSARIMWTTDLPADSEVRYGTDAANLSGAAAARELVTAHGVDLAGLAPDTVYYYDVLSTDQVGHTVSDDNGGAHYSFRTTDWGDVLVVIGDLTFPAEREASYAAALEASGWSWSFWRVANRGLPPLGLLQQVRAVVWQVGLEEYPTFNASAQALVKAYLDGGGRLLVVSHDTAWSLSDSASPWYNASNAAWVHGVLKASYVCDPTSITDVVGVSGDPVSGAYTGGVPYTPHRTGGADDELTALSVGGTSLVAWRDGGVAGCTANTPIGLRWISSAGNGTSGVGAWGGAPSRLAYFAFEITGTDTNDTDLRPNSTIRARVLDNALRWLMSTSASSLDRDHPNVTLLAPAADTYTGTSVLVSWNATTSGPGIAVASVTVSYSPDRGQTWWSLAILPGTATSYAWSTGSVPNGGGYRVRIAVQDDGVPPLDDQADSAVFALRRPGGDARGPLIVPGSLRITPFAPGAAAFASVNATADDSRTGDSPIAGAEFFLVGTPPAVGSYGFGIPMVPADGTFSESLEAVSLAGGFPAAPGSTCLWIHGQDAAGNWGPFTSVCFPVLDVGPDTVAPAPAVLRSVAFANAGADLAITWQRAWDDGLYGGAVRYRVLRAASAAGPYAPVGTDLATTGNLTYTFVDPGRGAADPSDAFYRVETFDGANNSQLTPAVASKFHIAATAGINLLGLPSDPGTATLDALTLGVTWSEAWTYDACRGDPWAVAFPGDAARLGLHAGGGFWINVSGPGTLVVLGITQAVTRMELCAGWNLVALPGFAAGLTVGDLEAATSVSRVSGFAASDPYHTASLAASDPLVPGRGYWVEAPRDTVWTVDGW